VATDALKQFLKASGSDKMLEQLETNNVWALMEKEDTCPHAMLHLARYISMSYLPTMNTLSWTGGLIFLFFLNGNMRSVTYIVKCTLKSSD
jgi:hypothetical protein